MSYFERLPYLGRARSFTPLQKRISGWDGMKQSGSLSESIQTCLLRLSEDRHCAREGNELTKLVQIFLRIDNLAVWSFCKSTVPGLGGGWLSLCLFSENYKTTGVVVEQGRTFDFICLISRWGFVVSFSHSWSHSLSLLWFLYVVPAVLELTKLYLPLLPMCQVLRLKECITMPSQTCCFLVCFIILFYAYGCFAFLYV